MVYKGPLKTKICLITKNYICIVIKEFHNFWVHFNWPFLLNIPLQVFLDFEKSCQEIGELISVKNKIWKMHWIQWPSPQNVWVGNDFCKRSPWLPSWGNIIIQECIPWWHWSSSPISIEKFCYKRLLAALLYLRFDWKNLGQGPIILHMQSWPGWGSIMWTW